MPAFTFNPNDLQRLNRLRFLAGAAALEQTAGGHRTRRAGEGTDFLDYRGYTAGDDFRKIDWGLYGRLRQLFVRLHEAPRQLAVVLLVDVSRSMLFGSPITKLHQAQRLACGLGFVGLRGGERVFCSAFADGLRGGGVGPLSGPRALGTMVRFLQNVEGGGGRSDLLEAARQLRIQRRGRGVIIIMSDFLNVPRCEEAMSMLLAGGARVLAVQVLDDLDRGIGLRAGSTVRLRDSETGAMVDVHIDGRALAEYQAKFEARRQQLEQFCIRRGQGYLHASTRDHYVERVAEALRSTTGVAR